LILVALTVNHDCASGRAVFAHELRDGGCAGLVSAHYDHSNRAIFGLVWDLPDP